MKITGLALSLVLVAACATGPAVHSPKDDLGLLWVKHSAEYEAIALQVYQSATDALPGYIEDKSWSALPGQDGAEALPTAVILDVDETVVSNVDFQLEFERPFANWKLDEWARHSAATPIPGVREFVEAARDQGVTVFFVTNRPCQPRAGIDDPCPQKQTTIDGIAEVGLATDAEHVLLSEEQGWNREKSTRRDFVAQTHRVIMLIGDDLIDFIPCMRSSPKLPCTAAATDASRRSGVADHAQYWGRGWYILPNPMHGSWTGVH
jgi:acid phosphatase